MRTARRARLKPHRERCDAVRATSQRDTCDQISTHPVREDRPNAQAFDVTSLARSLSQGPPPRFMAPERMRCVRWDATARVARCALPVLLLLASASDLFAQSPVCHTIRRGESAPDVARRLTGDSWNAYRTWFEIRNSASRPVPKSQYNRVRAGWQACMMKPATRAASAHANRNAVSDGSDAAEASRASAIPEATPAAVSVETAALVTADEVAIRRTESPEAATSDVRGMLRTLGQVDLLAVWLGMALVVPWFGWRMLDDRLARARTTTIVMRHFATRFVQEFARPLVWSDVERPLRSRVRYSARRGRVDILLAPGKGRRYPNLSDHKNNVEYDVARVVSALGDESFVNGPPYTQAEWIVVPFQFKSGPSSIRAFGAPAGQGQPGVTCISSL
jgi:hypothetical protein